MLSYCGLCRLAAKGCIRISLSFYVTVFAFDTKVRLLYLCYGRLFIQIEDWTLLKLRPRQLHLLESSNLNFFIIIRKYVGDGVQGLLKWRIYIAILFSFFAWCFEPSCFAGIFVSNIFVWCLASVWLRYSIFDLVKLLSVIERLGSYFYFFMLFKRRIIQDHSSGSFWSLGSFLLLRWFCLLSVLLIFSLHKKLVYSKLIITSMWETAGSSWSNEIAGEISRIPWTSVN